MSTTILLFWQLFSIAEVEGLRLCSQSPFGHRVEVLNYAAGSGSDIRVTGSCSRAAGVAVTHLNRVALTRIVTKDATRVAL